ncbi:MAG: lycopene cyclase family protein [Flavobacteriaceae bacterium]|jgi:lycopene beta-cyclase
MKKNCFDYIICGGGASGLMLTQRLLSDPYFKDKQLLLLEKEVKTHNDRTWCYWETPGGDYDDLLFQQWPLGTFKASNYKTDFEFKPLAYKMLRSAPFYQKMYAALEAAPNCSLVRENIQKIESYAEKVVVTTSNQTFEGQQAFSSLFDPKVLLQQKRYPVLQQHFLGWFVETKEALFDVNRITFMDFAIPQQGNTRFLYVLPFSANKALIEYTLFSKEVLTTAQYEEGLQDYLKQLGATSYKIIEKEQGTIPMCSYPMQQHNKKRLLHIGTAGGWTKASTGYTFKNADLKTQALVAFLKTKKPLHHFQKKNRFWVYDLLFLDVLSAHNAKGSALFSRLFEKNNPYLLFRFLSEQTNFWEELKIMSSFRLPQIALFVKALLKRLF